MKSKKNKSELSIEEEEFAIVNIPDSRKLDNSIMDKDDYLTLNIKKKNMEYIFQLVFIILLLFLILSGIFGQNPDSNKNIYIPVKYKNFINIAYAFDTSYQYITHVSMKSIMLSQNRDTFIIFHIMVPSKINDKEKEVIDKITKEYKNCELKYYYIGDRFKEINVKGYITWSTAMYYRLRLPDLLPNEKRVLYLDCDTLVYKDLTNLYNYNKKAFSMNEIPISFGNQKGTNFNQNIFNSEHKYNKKVIELLGLKINDLFSKQKHCIDIFYSANKYDQFNIFTDIHDESEDFYQHITIKILNSNYVSFSHIQKKIYYLK